MLGQQKILLPPPVKRLHELHSEFTTQWITQSFHFVFTKKMNNFHVYKMLFAMATGFNAE